MTGNAAMRWNIQEHMPLSALFFLQKSPLDSLTPLGKGACAASLYNSSRQARLVCLDQAEETRLNTLFFGNAAALASQVPAYVLGVSREGAFWKEMEKVM